MLTPDWPAPAGVRAACSTRAGGVSVSSYASLNLGDHVGDDPRAVAENRRRLAEGLQARPVFLKQVHGWGVERITHVTSDWTEADACWTDRRGVACTMMVADCLPVLLADRAGRVVGAAHCGWRGLAGDGGRGVLETLWQAMAPVVGPNAEQAAGEMLAWLGPCIGPEAFEVGGEVRDAFCATDAAAAACFRAGPAPGKYLADLQALARRRLHALDISAIHGNDGSREWCTVANPSRFFSHRRDRVSGRFAAGIWLA
jgi:YfiH family protein